MISTGLVSVTFRKLSPVEIVRLSVEAGIKGIEWGGDIHVPLGDLKQAREVSRITTESGMAVAAYGSYYKVGCPEVNATSFENVLETAAALGSSTIRIWAANKGSIEADQALFEKVVDESRELGEQAQKAGIKIAFEYHRNTLTDTIESTTKLLTDINHTNVCSYWQPPVEQSIEARLSDIQQLLPWLHHVHVFQWSPGEKHPLVEGKEEWISYFQTISKASGDRYAMLEFVRNDEPKQFLEDAKALKMILEAANVDYR